MFVLNCRYTDILRALHFSKTSAGVTNNDRFSKLGSFFPSLMAKFENFVNPGEFICIDESLMPYKGRLSFKQYVPSKRARFGVKFYVLVDCNTKAVLKLVPYLGKKSNFVVPHNTFGVGGAVIMTLLKDRYFNKFHRVVADNWFSTPQLAEELLKNNTYYLGTVQKRRCGVAKVQMATKLKKGNVQTLTNGNLLIERLVKFNKLKNINH